MLGLLMMAGLGFAATAIIDHMDNQTTDDAHPQDEDETASQGSMLDEMGPHGSLLDDHDPQAGHAIHSEAHSAPEVHHQDSQAHGHGHGHGHASHSHHEPAHHQAQHHATSHPSGHHASGHDQAAHHVSAHHGSGHHQAGHHQTGHHTNAAHHEPHAAASHDAQGQSGVKEPASKVFGTDGNDTLHGGNRGDLMEGQGGDDKLYGHGGNDNLVGFDAGHDTLIGGAGDDKLHGYLVQKQPGDLSYVVEDHQADHLQGGAGKDTLFLGSDDVGTGGQGADSFHVSWDVEHGHPAQITDYNPKLDKIFVEYTSNHANEGLTDIKPEEQTISTEPMEHGEGTSILINGQAIAHVLGAAHLNASDIGLIRA